VERNTDAMITQLLLLSAQEREQERQEKLLHVQEEEQELLSSMQQQHRALQRHDVLGMKMSNCYVTVCRLSCFQCTILFFIVALLREK
jgi:hypothetical protein